MGNVENKFEEREFTHLKDYAQVEKSTKDTRFGDFTLFSHIENFSKQIALLTKVHSSDQALENEMASANELKQLTDTPNLINIVFLEKKEKSEFCSNYWKLYAGLEYFPFSLAEEIQVRQNRKERFTETELLFIEEKYLRAVSDLEYNGVNHLSVSSKKFLIGPPSQAKLLYALPFGDYDHFLADEKYYFSPAMFSAHVHGSIPQHSPSKSDVFSIGMSLLHAASMRNPATLYDFDSAIIKEDKVKQRLDLLRNNYSDHFVDNLGKMLNFHEANRPSVADLNRSRDFSMIKPTDWLIYKEENPYAILKSRRGSRKSMSEQNDRMSQLQEFQNTQNLNKIQDPIHISDMKQSVNRQTFHESPSNNLAKPLFPSNHQVSPPLKTEIITEPNLLLSKDYGVSSPNKEGQVYATLLTNSKKKDMPKVNMPSDFLKPKGESKQESELDSKFDNDLYTKYLHPPKFENNFAAPVEKPNYTVNHFSNTAIHNHYTDLEPVSYKFTPPIERKPLPPLNTYERYTGVSGNVQNILNELKGSVTSNNLQTPTKYAMLRSAAQEAQSRNASPGNTDQLLQRYGLRKSFNGQSILMGQYSNLYNNMR